MRENYEENLIERLKDREIAKGYLQEVINISKEVGDSPKTRGQLFFDALNYVLLAQTEASTYSIIKEISL